MGPGGLGGRARRRVTSVRALRRELRQRGALHTQVQPWLWVSPQTFLCKSGAVGCVVALGGVDYECLDPAERAQIVRRWRTAAHAFGPEMHVYQYLLKRRAVAPTAATSPHAVVRQMLEARRRYFQSHGDRLFTIELFAVLVYDTPAVRQRMTQRFGDLVRDPVAAFSRTRTTALIADEIERASAHLTRKVEAWIAQLGDTVAPRLLPKAEAFGMLRRLLNYDPVTAAAQHHRFDTHLDYFLCDSHLTPFSSHLRMDDYYVRLLTFKDPPTRTYANLLQTIYEIPSELVIASEWHPEAPDRTRSDLRMHQRHWHNKRTNLWSHMNRDAQAGDLLEDRGATALVEQLGAALMALDVDGLHYGYFALSVILYDREARRLDHAVDATVKAFSERDDATVVEERDRSLHLAWLAALPGNWHRQARYCRLSEANFADLSFVFTLDSGSRWSRHLDAEYLAAFETEHDTLYFHTLHYHDVGHCLVLGATGAGKSVVVNHLLTHAGKYDPLVYIFDLGGSYDTLTARMGGSYRRVGVTEQGFEINPFCLTPTRDNLTFIYNFMRVLLGAQVTLRPEHEQELYEAITNMYEYDPALRRVTTLVNTLPAALRPGLERWVAGGVYGHVFDHVEDTLTFAQFQCFDFAGMDRVPDILEALLYYILHRASLTIEHPTIARRLKLFVLDESWRFVRDTRVQAFVHQGLKTWRKANASVLLATQAAEDFASVNMFQTVAESCATKLFLANASLDPARYREWFHLNQTETRLIQDLVPRRQLLLKRPDIAKVLNLRLTPEELALYTPPRTAPAISAGDAARH